MPIKHKFISPVLDDLNAKALGKVVPSDWNDEHELNLDVSEVAGAYPSVNPAGYIDAAYVIAKTGSAGGLGNRNFLDNASFVADQKNNGVFVPSFIGTAWNIDRWQDQTTNARFNVSQTVFNSPNLYFSHGKLITVPYDINSSSNNICALNHTIETLELADLQYGTASAAPITLSFEVNTTVTGNHGFAIQNNHSTRRSYVTFYNVPIAGVWTPIEITIPGDALFAIGNGQNTPGLTLRWVHGAGLLYQTPTGDLHQWQSGDVFFNSSLVPFCNEFNKQWDIRRVKLELGTKATFFDIPKPADTFNTAYRYFENGYIKEKIGNAGSAFFKVIPFKTKKRDEPTVTVTMLAGLQTEVTATADYFMIEGTTNASGVLEFNWAASAEI